MLGSISWYNKILIFLMFAPINTKIKAMPILPPGWQQQKAW